MLRWMCMFVEAAKEPSATFSFYDGICVFYAIPGGHCLHLSPLCHTFSTDFLLVAWLRISAKCAFNFEQPSTHMAFTYIDALFKIEREKTRAKVLATIDSIDWNVMCANILRFLNSTHTKRSTHAKFVIVFLPPMCVRKYRFFGDFIVFFFSSIGRRSTLLMFGMHVVLLLYSSIE